MRRGRVFAACVAAACCFGGPGAPGIVRAVALAPPVPPVTVHDAAGDTPEARGDLVGAGVLQNTAGTAFAVAVKSPTDPGADANWRAGRVRISWYLDVNGNGMYEYLVQMAVDPATRTLAAVVTDPSGAHLFCDAVPVFVAGVGYRVVAGSNCLPHLTTVRFAACMTYGESQSQLHADCAPDDELGPLTGAQAAVLRYGYWMLAADGRVYPFGGAVGFAGEIPGAMAMTPRDDGRGYWVVDFAGHVFAYGTARYLGGAPPLEAAERVSAISAKPKGDGYWLFTNRGRTFAYGNAKTFGDMSGVSLNGPIIASVATPTGRGYYMVGSDGGIFSFGDARFHGSTGGMRLNQPVVGIAPTPSGSGYWLVASDGGVFAFDAPFRGSMGATTLNRPVGGIVAFGDGYLMAGSDGGIFDFSNKPFLGSLAGAVLSAPIVGVAAFAS